MSVLMILSETEFFFFLTFTPTSNLKVDVLCYIKYNVEPLTITITQIILYKNLLLFTFNRFKILY